MVNKPTLDYENPTRTAAKRQLRRYTTTVLLVSLAVGALLVWGWRVVLTAEAARHIGWVTRLGPSARQLIGFGFLCVPLGLGILLRNRAERKLIGAELDAEKAKQRRLLNEERTGIGWKVPRAAEAADWPKAVLIIGVSYAVTFLFIVMFGFLMTIVNSLAPSLHLLIKDDSVLHGAFLCANVIGGTMSLIALFLFLCSGARVTLTSDGVFERFGIGTKLIPYSSINEVRIEPSRRRRSLKCVAVLANDERFGQRWHRYELGNDAPVEKIVKTFASKGLPVRTHEPEKALHPVLHRHGDE